MRSSIDLPMTGNALASRRTPPMRSRPVGLALLTTAVGGFLAYLVLDVPVAAPLPGGHTLWFCPLYARPLASALRERYWWVALAALP